MNADHKAEIIEDLAKRLTPKGISFIGNMREGFGNLLKNNKRADAPDNEPDFLGYARLENGKVIHIRGSVKESGKTLTMPLIVVEVPDELIGEQNGYHAETNFNSPSVKHTPADKFLGR